MAAPYRFECLAQLIGGWPVGGTDRYSAVFVKMMETVSPEPNVNSVDG